MFILFGRRKIFEFRGTVISWRFGEYVFEGGGPRRAVGEVIRQVLEFLDGSYDGRVFLLGGGEWLDRFVRLVNKRIFGNQRRHHNCRQPHSQSLLVEIV